MLKCIINCSCQSIALKVKHWMRWALTNNKHEIIAYLWDGKFNDKYYKNLSYACIDSPSHNFRMAILLKKELHVLCIIPFLKFDFNDTESWNDVGITVQGPI